MIRSLVSLSLASALAVACSQTGPPPAATPATGSAAPGAAAATQPQATTQPPSGATQPPPSAAQPSAPVERAPASAPTAPPEPPAPRFREVTIPEGTSLSVTVTTPVASDSSKVEDLVQGTLAKPIVVSGTTVVPRGSELTGSVIEATESARVKGRAAIAFRFDRIASSNDLVDVDPFALTNLWRAALGFPTRGSATATASTSGPREPRHSPGYFATFMIAQGDMGLRQMPPVRQNRLLSKILPVLARS